MKNVNYAVYLKNLRLKAGLTQAEVAKVLGYSNPQFVSNWERGISLPAVNSLATLAKLYGVSINRLFDPYMRQLRQDLWKKATG